MRIFTFSLMCIKSGVGYVKSRIVKRCGFGYRLDYSSEPV